MIDMQEQFVKYEIALKLKELGFDEKCMAYFVENKNRFIYDINGVSNFSKGKGNFLGSKCVAAPLWQQVIDWLFKELDFYYPMLSFKVFSDGSGEWYNPKDEGYNSLEINFDNKEEMILKAIEIIKNK